LRETRTELALGRKLDGPFLLEIPHQRVTANNGRGELVMKNWKTCIGGERTASALITIDFINESVYISD
jgi:hypothetical protein